MQARYNRLFETLEFAFSQRFYLRVRYRADVAAALGSESEIPEGDAETSLTALEELAQKDKNLFVRLLDMVKRFISNLKGHNTNASVVRDLQKLERKLKDVYESTQTENPTDNGGVKYSIKNYIKFNKDEVINLSLDKELIKRINSSNKSPITEMRDYIFEKLGGLDLELSDGKIAIVDKSDAKHIANNSKKDFQKSELSNIEDIIRNAKFYREVTAEHPKFTKFRYYEIPVKFSKK